MVKELVHDPIFLAGKSEVATKEDLQVAQDLLDTLMAHKETCVGMAANMIGVRKRIIAFLDESGRAPTYTVMLNPEIIKKDGAYDTEECCLSLLGGLRKCKRYKTIKRLRSFHMLVRLSFKLGFSICEPELPHVEAWFRKGGGIRDQIANIHRIMVKAREFQKNIYFCFID